MLLVIVDNEDDVVGTAAAAPPVDDYACSCKMFSVHLLSYKEVYPSIYVCVCVYFIKHECLLSTSLWLKFCGAVNAKTKSILRIVEFYCLTV